MTKVCQVDCTTGGGLLEKNFGSNHTGDIWVSCDVAMNAIGLTGLKALTGSSDFLQTDSHTSQSSGVTWYVDTGPTVKWAGYNDINDPASTPFNPASAIIALQFYRVVMHVHTGSPITQHVTIDGTDIGTMNVTSANQADVRFIDLFQPGITSAAGGFLYFDNITVGTTEGASDIFSDDFESGNLSSWTTADAIFSVVTDPGITPAGETSAVVGRVLIAWDDAPLEANPVWTPIDQGGSTFPYDFVSGYDTHSGRQTLIAQTETGTATVFVNDREGLFDDRNGSSPFQGKLSGRQIMLQLYNPVDATWEPQFRGLIDDYRYTMDGSAVGADGNPVNASIEIDCVDMFDYLNGYGLTPGVDGTTPPAGAEDSIYFAASGVSDTVEDRILEILGNANIDPSMSITASGNIQVIATQYNADESALTALRDAADAELPFIGNIYVNRSGQFCFRGRYSSFAPDQTAAEAGSTWDFTRWPVGDGKAIQADPTRAQIRVLEYSRDRADLINAALCYPQGLAATAIPDQVYANSASITAYGKHQLNPFTDLITAKYVGPGTISPDDGKTQCFMYAELLVKNKKDPRVCPTAVQLKSINPSDFRATATWATLTRSDISHIVNIAVGYAGGTGLMGAATTDDYYIQGRSLTVRPANSAYDYVELNLDVTPFVWSADTNGVFPAFGT